MRRAVRAASIAVLVAVLVALPRLAHACPTCANSDEGPSTARYVVLGLMILFPFTIAFVVYRVLRTASGQPRTPELGRAGVQAPQEK